MDVDVLMRMDEKEEEEATDTAVKGDDIVESRWIFQIFSEPRCASVSDRSYLRTNQCVEGCEVMKKTTSTY